MAYSNKLSPTTIRSLEQQRRDREARERQEARAVEEAREQNRAARERYLVGLEQKRQARQREEDLKIDAQLEPQKTQLRRQWLADHPTQTERDFETRAWPGLRANLIDQERARAVEETKRSMILSGGYGF
ncbi:MAG: hypothetical protein KIT57_03655 [Blastocatellales bacterium]|nr:hypothetical protein [Blastocatellales bacterium]